MGVRTTPVQYYPVLRCEVCGFMVKNRDDIDGFMVVDLAETVCARGGKRAEWHIYHSKCAPETIALNNSFFRVWTSALSTSNDLLEAIAELSRKPWFSSTNWGYLVQSIMNETYYNAECPRNRRKPKSDIGRAEALLEELEELVNAK